MKKCNVSIPYASGLMRMGVRDGFITVNILMKSYLNN